MHLLNNKMSKNNQMIKEKYRATTIDEILELIEVDKKKYNAEEQILKKEIKRKMPLFWKKSYVYEVEFKPNASFSSNVVKREVTDKDAILEMLNGPVEESVKEIVPSPTKTMTAQIIAVPQEAESSTENAYKLFEEYRGKLLDAEVNQRITDMIIEQTRKELNELEWEQAEKVEKEILNQMQKSMGETFQLKLTEAKKVVLIGPTGVGKTTTIGKMAGILVSHGKKVGFITTDIYRMGAVYQLKEYAKILNSTIEAAHTPKELEEAIYYFENVEKVDHILIDTVGRSPMDAGNVQDIKTYLELANPDHISLVLSCTQKEKDIYKIIENFEKANINSLIFTKLDETLNHGIIMNVMADKKAKVSFITNGQDVPQDIYIANAEKLANKILRGVDEFERPSI